MKWSDVYIFFIYMFIFLRKSTYISWVHIEQKIQTAKKIIVEIQMIQAVEMCSRIKLSYFAFERKGKKSKTLQIFLLQ